MNTDIPALLSAKAIPTRYIANYFHGNITNERIRQINSLMDPDALICNVAVEIERIRQINSLMDPAVPINSDRTPHLMQLMLDQWFARFNTTPTGFYIVLAILAAGYLIP